MGARLAPTRAEMVRPRERSRLFDRRRQVLFVGDVLASPDLDERFTTSEESDHSRPRIEHDAAKLSIGHIAASQPHNLRRWTLLSEQLREIIILRDDHDRVRCGASRREDFGVARTMQPEFLDVVSTRARLSLKPPRQSRRRPRPEAGCEAGWRTSVVSFTFKPVCSRQGNYRRNEEDDSCDFTQCGSVPRAGAMDSPVKPGSDELFLISNRYRHPSSSRPWRASSTILASRAGSVTTSAPRRRATRPSRSSCFSSRATASRRVLTRSAIS